VAGDLLFHGSSLGLNAPVWLALLTARASTLTRAEDCGRGPDAALPWLRAGALACAACLAWRDGPFLRLLDVAGLLILLGLAVLARRGTPIASGLVLDYARAALSLLFNLSLGALALATTGVPWSELQMAPAARRVAALGLGLVLALPLVLVFGALFASADPVFDGFVRGLFDWDVETAVSHVALAGFLTVLAAGIMRSQLPAGFAPRPGPLGPLDGSAWAAALGGALPKPGFVPIAVALGAMATVFTLFVGLQARLFLAGDAYVRATTGLTYAEYVHRGFGELVAATALTLPVLYGAEWLTRNDKPAQRQTLHALATVQLVLVGMVVLAALQRMRLYVDAYGLTLARLYATAFVLWVAFVLGWFALTVLRGRRSRFAFGAAAAALATVLGLNVMNPAALVVRVNVDRAAGMERFDAGYLARLGADAVPALTARLGSLAPAARCEVLGLLGESAGSDGADGWRGWSLSRHRAAAALRGVGREAAACDAVRRAEPAAVSDWPAPPPPAPPGPS
jgi:hypothetical protein